MRQNPPEIIIASLSFMVFWVMIVLIILVAGRTHPKIHDFRSQMITWWKPALVITGLFVLGMGLGGRGYLNPYALAVFCQALVGLAIAGSIDGFDPLPVTRALIQRKQILRQVFGEQDYTQQAANTLPPDTWSPFFLLLSGSGIAEETPYRLALLSFLWKVLKRKRLAIFLSALVFSAYHLTPLSGMYRVFWQFPISQFTASTLIGLVWGYLYTWRGYETTVLGHTLSNWLPMLIFMS
jgi:membrane protease YdiL (CAAX protease family)